MYAPVLYHTSKGKQICGTGKNIEYGMGMEPVYIFHALLKIRIYASFLPFVFIVRSICPFRCGMFFMCIAGLASDSLYLLHQRGVCRKSGKFITPSVRRGNIPGRNGSVFIHFYRY